MARPSWTDIPDADVSVNSALEAADVGQALRDNMNALRITPLAIYFAEASTTDTSYAVLATLYILVPDFDDYDSIQRTLTAYFEVKVADASATGTFKFDITAYSLTSNQVTTTSTSYEYKAPTVNLTAATQGQILTVRVKGYTSNASYAAYARSINSIGWFIEY